MPKIDGVVESPNDLFSGTKRLCSSFWTSSCSASRSSSASTQPSRIAWATDVPLITAVNDRRYRFFSTMLYEKDCCRGMEDSMLLSETALSTLGVEARTVEVGIAIGGWI